MAKRDESKLRRLNASYRQLMTAAQDNRALALIEAAAKTQYQRDEFAREVWEATREGVRISHITEATGAARTTIYKLLKEFQENNRNLGAINSKAAYSFDHVHGSNYEIHGGSWVKYLRIKDGKPSFQGMKEGTEEDFQREFTDEMTGLRARIQSFVDDTRGYTADEASNREDLDDENEEDFE